MSETVSHVVDKAWLVQFAALLFNGESKMHIFGLGRRTKHIQATVNFTCQQCTQSNRFQLTLVRTWFMLFFIPVVPYEIDHWLFCENCGCGFKLVPEEYERIKADAANAQKRGITLNLDPEVKSSV